MPTARYERTDMPNGDIKFKLITPRCRRGWIAPVSHPRQFKQIVDYIESLNRAMDDIEQHGLASTLITVEALKSAWIAGIELDWTNSRIAEWVAEREAQLERYGPAYTGESS